MFKKRFSEILAKKKKVSGISQAWIARSLGITPASITDWKTGRSEPSLEMLFKLSESINEPVSSFFPMQERHAREGKNNKFDPVDFFTNFRFVKNLPEGFSFTTAINDTLEPTISPGDTVLIGPAAGKNNGEILAVVKDESKDLQFYRSFCEDNLLILLPEKKGCNPVIRKDAKKLEIKGQVIAVIKKFA